MILILSRLVDSDKFKKMTNWPHCSPVRSTFVPPKEGELTYKDALPMQIDLPGKDSKYQSVVRAVLVSGHKSKSLNRNNSSKEKETRSCLEDQRKCRT